MILLADLHGISYGKDNIRLTETIRKLAPDVILSAGDMAVRTETNTLVTACKLLTELAGDFPVYYALGNHEYKNVPFRRIPAILCKIRKSTEKSRCAYFKERT